VSLCAPTLSPPQPQLLSVALARRSRYLCWDALGLSASCKPGTARISQPVLRRTGFLLPLSVLHREKFKFRLHVHSSEVTKRIVTFCPQAAAWPACMLPSRCRRAVRLVTPTQSQAGAGEQRCSSTEPPPCPAGPLPGRSSAARQVRCLLQKRLKRLCPRAQPHHLHPCCRCAVIVLQTLTRGSVRDCG